MKERIKNQKQSSSLKRQMVFGQGMPFTQKPEGLFFVLCGCMYACMCVCVCVCDCACVCECVRMQERMRYRVRYVIHYHIRFSCLVLWASHMYHRGIRCFRHAFIFLIIIKVSEKVLSKEVQKRFHHVSFSPKEHDETAMNTATSQDSYGHSNFMWQLRTQQCHETETDVIFGMSVF